MANSEQSARNPRLLDLFCGEGGAGMGYYRAGFDVFGVDNAPARLKHYPFESIKADALRYALDHGHEYDVIHASPPCQAYSRGTAALPDRLERYDRLIAVTRDVLETVGKPYVIENVEDAKRELRSPLTLCGTMFGLMAYDPAINEIVWMKRHRLFESNIPLTAPEPCQCLNRKRSGMQCAGSYGGARRNRDEARHVRKGGYVPSVQVQRALLRNRWMTEVGCRLSIPSVYARCIGKQLITALSSVTPDEEASVA